MFFADPGVADLHRRGAPIPGAPEAGPIGMQFRFDTFIYFFVLLAHRTAGLFLANGHRDGGNLGSRLSSGGASRVVSAGSGYNLKTHAALAENGCGPPLAPTVRDVSR